MSKSNAKAYFEHTISVSNSDLDDLEHVNNAVYLRYVETCARAHAEREGLTLEQFKMLGVIPVVRRHTITYYQSAKLGDKLLVSTQITKMGGPKAERHNQVHLAKSKALLVDAITEWVWLDPKSQRPKRVPEAIYKAFGFTSHSG